MLISAHLTPTIQNYQMKRVINVNIKTTVYLFIYLFIHLLCRSSLGPDGPSNTPVATGPAYGSRSPQPLQPQRMPRLCCNSSREKPMCAREHKSTRVAFVHKSTKVRG